MGNYPEKQLPKFGALQVHENAGEFGAVEWEVRRGKALPKRAWASQIRVSRLPGLTFKLGMKMKHTKTTKDKEYWHFLADSMLYETTKLVKSKCGSYFIPKDRKIWWETCPKCDKVMMETVRIVHKPKPIIINEVKMKFGGK